MSQQQLKGYEPTVSDTVKTVHFTGRDEDWNEWSFRFKALLAQQQLIDYVRPDFTFNSSDDLHHPKNTLLYYKIVTAVHNDAFTIVRGVTEGDGNGAWKALFNRYEKMSQLKKDQLLQKVFSPSFNHLRSDERIDTFIDRILEIRRQLNNAGEKLSDQVIIGIIKNGLPWKEYETVLTHIQLNGMLNFDEQIQILKTHGEQVRQRIGSHRPREQSQSASHKSSSEQALQSFDSKPSDDKPRKCKFCGDTSHNKWKCPSKPKPKYSDDQDKSVKTSESSKGKSSSLCAYCGYRGHTSIDCRYRINAEKRIADAT